jgi:hypothetical protein
MRTFSSNSLVAVATTGTKRSYQPGLKTVFLLMYFRTEGVGVMGHRLCAHVATFSAKPHTRYTNAFVYFPASQFACKWSVLGVYTSTATTARGAHGWGVVDCGLPQPIVSWLELDKRSLFGYIGSCGHAWAMRCYEDGAGVARWPRSHCMFFHARPFRGGAAMIDAPARVNLLDYIEYRHWDMV